MIQISRVVPHIRMQTSTRAPTFYSWFQDLSLSSIICFIIFIPLLKLSLILSHPNPIHFFNHFFLLSLFLVFIFKILIETLWSFSLTTFRISWHLYLLRCLVLNVQWNTKKVNFENFICNVKEVINFSNKCLMV